MSAFLFNATDFHNIADNMKRKHTLLISPLKYMPQKIDLNPHSNRILQQPKALQTKPPSLEYFAQLNEPELRTKTNAGYNHENK